MGDTPSSSSPSRDPTILSIIARGLNPTKGPKEFSDFGTDTERRQARVLDSLAYLLVSRGAKQVIAVGLRLCSDGTGLELLVADNGSPSRTTLNHAVYIIRHLHDIYMKLPIKDKPSRIDTFYTLNTGSSFERAVIELECIVIKHSWAKLRQRLRKHSRYLHFLDTARNVCGVPAAERADILDDKERSQLHTLQTFDLFSQHDIDTQFKVLECLVTVVDLDELGDTAVDAIRLLLYRMATWKERIQRNNSYRRQWDAYTAHRLAKRQCSSDNPGPGVRQDTPDVAHWLSKITEHREHFHRLIEVVLSPKLAPLLLDIVGVRQITAAVPTQHNPTVTLSIEELRQVLDTSDVKTVRRFLRTLRRTQGGTWFSADKERIVLDPGPIHCECQILAQIHGTSAVPYIGVSKLSCARCDMYLSVYRSRAGASIYTRGTNGQITQWTYPALGNSEKIVAIERLVRSKFLNMIWHGWEEYSRPPPDAVHQESAEDALQAALARLETGLESFQVEP